MTCVKFIEGSDGKKRLVSADDAGNVRIWRRDEGTKVRLFTMIVLRLRTELLFHMSREFSGLLL